MPELDIDALALTPEHRADPLIRRPATRRTDAG